MLAILGSRVEGLSPRVRGNHPHHGPPRGGPGSIPARAGEPRLPGSSREGRRVYPRACGGTTRTVYSTFGVRGLSPRVRGNHPHHGPPRGGPGSIPARAGEPRTAPLPSCARRVYPRACGGTVNGTSAFVGTWGLSPRVRGNRLQRPHGELDVGSIPARAGEPPSRRLPGTWKRVYPRACGGTSMTACVDGSRLGLSPRVRGNQLRHALLVDQQGSIPARAGEPPVGWAELACLGVYPRACGGTAILGCAFAKEEGLSPRVRGNR